MKKVISLILAISVFASVGIVSAKNTYTDTSGHWAEKQINSWSEHGVISGYDGQFSPNRSITRGEFAVVLNKLMAYSKTTENRFADLGEKYYTDSILKLNKAGVMQGYDGKISPEASLTREEASVMICRALGIETQGEANKTFSDLSEVSEWARPYINAMVNKGLLNGSDGKLNPKNSISRAEVVTILDNSVFPILRAGTYSGIRTDKIFVISSGDVTIGSSVIGGKIIVTQGAIKGNVTFFSSELNGQIVVDNEREDIIVLENTTIGDQNKTEADDENKENKDDKDDKESSGGGGGGGGNGGGKDDKPNTPDEPNKPDNPETPDNPTTPDTPDTPDNPSTPDEPETPDNPSIPDEPETPDEPDAPDEPDEPEEPVDYSKLNAEMVENLKLISDDIALYIDPKNSTFYSIFTNEEKYMLKNIKRCIDDALTYADKEEIDADFIKSTYNDDIEDVQSVYDELKENDKHGEFHKKLATNLTTYTLIWLADTLGIDLSEYGIDVSAMM